MKEMGGSITMNKAGLSRFVKVKVLSKSIPINKARLSTFGHQPLG